MKEKALDYDQLREILSPVHPSVLFDMAYDLLMDDPEQDDLHDFDEVELLDLVASEAADRGWSETDANEVIEDYGGDHYGRTREAKEKENYSALFERALKEADERVEYDPGIDSYVREVGRFVSEAMKHTTMNAKKAADQIASAFLFGCYSGSRGLSPLDARKLFERMKRGEQHVSLQ